MCDLSWGMFHVYLQTMCILLFGGWRSVRIYLSLYGLLCLYGQYFLTDILSDLNIGVSGVLKFIIILLLVSSCICVNICFMYLGAPLLGA